MPATPSCSDELSQDHPKAESLSVRDLKTCFTLFSLEFECNLKSKL